MYGTPNSSENPSSSSSSGSPTEKKPYEFILLPPISKKGGLKAGSKHIRAKDSKIKNQEEELRRKLESEYREHKKKKARRFRPGTVALREIKKYQASTNSLIKKAPFKRLLKSIYEELGIFYRV